MFENIFFFVQGEESEDKEKKKGNRASSIQPQGRPFLLRRGTATNATGSFKRRSLKLRRGTKEGESDCKMVLNNN